MWLADFHDVDEAARWRPTNDKDWNEPIPRVDIDPKDQKGLRMATGRESSANALWKPGGETPGGAPEAVIDPVPKRAVKGRCVTS